MFLRIALVIKRLGWCAMYIRVQVNEHKLLSYCGLMLSSSGVGG